MICKVVVNDLKVTSSTYQTMMQRCWDDYIMGSTADHTGAYSEVPFQKAKKLAGQKKMF